MQGKSSMQHHSYEAAQQGAPSCFLFIPGMSRARPKHRMSALPPPGSEPTTWDSTEQYALSNTSCRHGQDQDSLEQCPGGDRPVPHPEAVPTQQHGGDWHAVPGSRGPSSVMGVWTRFVSALSVPSLLAGSQA